ncbi:MAG: hypothetical protein HY841_03985 [Bacteroidetes bacterium]|nr:hypothetical protein [Bacteroidota bacterium]
MEKSTNTYEKEAKKKKLLGGITKDLETKGDLKNTAIETVKDVVVGALGGGVVGAALGRASLAVGAVITGIGHYTKSRLASIFGLGMMASGTYQKPGVNGTEDKQDLLEGAKERVLSFKENIQQKLWLDKVLKGKKKEEKNDEKKEGTNGVGEVQYFIHPSEEKKVLEGADEKEPDMSAMDTIEKLVAKSGEEFIQKQEMKGSPDSDSEMGALDPTERNY